jgi:hypothetical protein
VRGGAIPILAWGLLLFILFIGNSVWNVRLVDSLAAGFAALAIFLFGAALILLGGRTAVRRGPPEHSADPTPVAAASVGAAACGVAIACILFGFVFGSFLIYFGAGLLAFALGRVVVEVRAERALLRELSTGRRREEEP